MIRTHQKMLCISLIIILLILLAHLSLKYFKTFESVENTFFSTLQNAHSLGKVGIGPWGKCDEFLDQNAEWIWSSPNAINKVEANKVFAFIYKYNNNSSENIEAIINVIVDDSGEIYLNNEKIGNQRGGWGGSGGNFNIILKPGENVFVIKAVNLGSGENPAGLLATVVDKEKNILFSSNATWKYTDKSEGLDIGLGIGKELTQSSNGLMNDDGDDGDGEFGVSELNNWRNKWSEYVDNSSIASLTSKNKSKLITTEIFIGNSSTNSKTIEIPMGIVKVDPEYINYWSGKKCNGPNTCGVSDKFKFDISTKDNRKYLTVTRLDSGGGWGMQLKVNAQSRDLSSKEEVTKNSTTEIGELENNYTYVNAATNSTVIDNILEKKEWEISTDVSITDKSTKWRNLFHYGNSNRIRAPAMWLWPNDTWRFHFRIKTSKRWNDGVDFYVPKQFRIPGKDFNLRIQHKENKNSSKFIVYINNVLVHEEEIGLFLRVKNQEFDFKKPWAYYTDLNNYTISNFGMKSLNNEITDSNNNGTLAQANKVNNVTSNQNNNILEWSKKFFRKY